jgi:hypothetical protein
LTQAIAAADAPRANLLLVAMGGVLSGILTPLVVPLMDKIGDGPGGLRIALVALPFAVLAFVLVQRFSASPPWAALLAAIVTAAAFVGAVYAAIWIDGQAYGADKLLRNILAGLAGGFVGASLMSLGIGLLPASPRDAVAWMPMLLTGTMAGALLALDNALGLDRSSVLYPVWQAGVAVRLAMVLRRGALS